MTKFYVENKLTVPEIRILRFMKEATRLDKARNE